MVSQNLRQAHLQEVDLTQIRRDHDFLNKFSNKIDCKAYSKMNSMIDSKTNKQHQIILSNW